MILPTTYRYGQSIIDFSTEILQAAGHCDIPNLNTSKVSNVVHMDVDDYFDYGIPNITESTYHLVRCGYMAYSIASRLIECGIPFTGLFGWSDADISIYNGLVEYRNEGNIFASSLCDLIKIHPGNFFGMDKTKLVESITNGKKLAYTKSDIMKIVSPLSSFSDSNFLASLNDPLKCADVSDIVFNRITNCLDSLNGTLDKSNINTALMTIHGSKGMQANNVFVWDETNRTITNMSDETDGMLNESRVWYVASTRCKGNLYWVDSNKRNAWEVNQ